MAFPTSPGIPGLHKNRSRSTSSRGLSASPLMKFLSADKSALGPSSPVFQMASRPGGFGSGSMGGGGGAALAAALGAPVGGPVGPPEPGVAPPPEVPVGNVGGDIVPPTPPSVWQGGGLLPPQPTFQAPAVYPTQPAPIIDSATLKALLGPKPTAPTYGGTTRYY
jgi:hypothetical protein